MFPYTKNGKKLLLEKGNTPFETKFRKLSQSVIQYKVKARDLVGQSFGTTVCDSQGVRFVVKIKNESNHKKSL